MTQFLPHPDFRPMPDDFNPVFAPANKQGTVMAWRGSVTIAKEGSMEQTKLELGYHTDPRDPLHEAKLVASAKLCVWQAMELARLGLGEQLAHVRADRHRNNRPISKPPSKLAPPPETVKPA